MSLNALEEAAEEGSKAAAEAGNKEAAEAGSEEAAEAVVQRIAARAAERTAAEAAAEGAMEGGSKGAAEEDSERAVLDEQPISTPHNLNARVAAAIKSTDGEYMFVLTARQHVEVNARMLKRLCIPAKGKEKEAYLCDGIMDIMIHLASASSDKTLVVGKSNFFYSKLVNPRRGGQWNHASAAGWTRRQQLFDDKGRLLLLPINWPVGSHWLLVAIDLEAGEILVFDSMGTHRPDHAGIVSNVRRWLRAELKSRVLLSNSRNTQWSKCAWDLRYPVCHKQESSYDCGVFVVAFCWLLAGCGLAHVSRFDQEQVLGLRVKILDVLLSRGAVCAVAM